MCKAIPAVNVLRGQLRRDFDGIFIEDVFEYPSKPSIYLCFVHPDNPFFRPAQLDLEQPSIPSNQNQAASRRFSFLSPVLAFKSRFE
jgi:hypothetical protein